MTGPLDEKESAAKFCSTCGAACGNGSQFCHKCGSQISGSASSNLSKSKMGKEQKGLLYGLGFSLIWLFLPNAGVGSTLSEKIIDTVNVMADPIGWIALIAIFLNMYCVYAKNYFASILLSAFAGLCFLIEAIAITSYANNPPAFVRVELHAIVLWAPIAAFLVFAYRANKLRTTVKQEPTSQVNPNKVVDLDAYKKKKIPYTSAAIFAAAIVFFVYNHWLKQEPNKASNSSQISQQASNQKISMVDLPQIHKGENYTDVRRKMLNAGWRPYHADGADKCSENDTRCTNRPEMYICAGTGLGNCKFLWKRDDKISAICTVGDERAVFESICSF